MADRQHIDNPIHESALLRRTFKCSAMDGKALSKLIKMASRYLRGMS